MENMIFVLSAIAFMYFGRKLGWAVSKNILYVSPVSIVFAVCLFWGAGVACGVHALIALMAPNIVLKIILGFLLGAYIAIPNFGLIAESTIPPENMLKHHLISMLPLWIYIFASIALAWLL